MMAADPATLDRLAKICGLFGSDQLGERAAAAQRAETLRRKTGLSWAELLTANGGTASQGRAPEFDPERAGPAALLAKCAPVLTDWEREFLASIGSQRTYTQRQANRLSVIREKCASWWANGGRA
ncbi:hypothetical protein ACBY01_07155 [Sphingomonas sp. ac-8]|uniref:hypothetical protein n=1 Tax=Sphingomonas sp. ac-8 TaxID=3242977 RepID=UPI003A7FD9EE